LRYENYYLLNNFKRDRYTFHTSLAYQSRIAKRYLDVLRQQLTWYALLRADFTDSAPPGFFAAENGWGSFTQAVTEGFDLIGRIITKPEAGGFVKVDAAKSTDYPLTYWKHSGEQLAQQSYPAGARLIGLLDGKFASTTWDFDGCGYYWADECQTRIGYFFDKTVALEILSQSQAYFTGRDTSTDVRRYAIGYILPFKNQIQEKLGALLAGDYQSLAPAFDANGKLALPRWTVDSDGSGRPDLIDPSTGFTLQLYAGVYGLSSFPTTFDHSFIESTKIFVVGNGEAAVPDSQLTALNAPGGVATDNPLCTTARKPEGNCLVTNAPANGYEWFVWKDSTTGKSYAAHSQPKVSDGETRPPNAAAPATYRNDTGVRILETAYLIDQSHNVQALNLFRQNIEVMRSLHNAYGYGSYKTDAPFIY
jgi:hypothetical protein